MSNMDRMTKGVKIETVGNLDKWLTDRQAASLKLAANQEEIGIAISSFIKAVSSRLMRETLGDLQSEKGLHEPRSKAETLEDLADRHFVETLHHHFLEEVAEQSEDLERGVRRQARKTFHSVFNRLNIPQDALFDYETRMQCFHTLVPSGDRSWYERLKDCAGPDTADHFYALSDGFEIKRVIQEIQATYFHILRGIPLAAEDIRRLPDSFFQESDEGEIENAA